MGTFGDFVEITSSATPLAEGSGGIIKVPVGARIIQAQVFNLLGTGSVCGIRFEFPGMVTPQKYCLNQTAVLDGTEVGTGAIATRPVDLDITIPAGVTEVKCYMKASVASQTLTVYLKWVK